MSTEKPNIVVIMADSHRWDCIGANGNSEIETPNLDSLAEDGVSYQNSFCVAPSCVPSRHSFLTGTYLHQNQAYYQTPTTQAREGAFPTIFKMNGYRTKAIGNMDLIPTYLDIGFDDMELAEQGEPGRYEDDYHEYLREKNVVDQIDLIDQIEAFRQKAPSKYWETFGALQSKLPEEDYSTTWIGEKALADINNWGNESNLLMISFIKPHHPFDPPAPWSDMYTPDDLSLLPGWTADCLSVDLKVDEGYLPNKKLSKKILKQVMAHYYGAISQIDYYIGKIIAKLKETGNYDNTLILYTSDHGEYMGFHHMLLKGNNMYDPLMKVPLIIKYPNQQHKGTTCERIVSNIDIAPTLLSTVFNNENNHLPGYNLLSSESERSYAFAEKGRGQQYMLRSPSYKLLLNENKSESLFFDLTKDPLELTNLYTNSSYQPIISEFERVLFHEFLSDHSFTEKREEEAPIIPKGRYRKEAISKNKEWTRKKMESGI